jgi:hypothetical protein
MAHSSNLMRWSVRMSAEPLPSPAAPDLLVDETTNREADSQWPAPLRYGMGIVLISICVAGLLLILPLLQIVLLSHRVKIS